MAGAGIMAAYFGRGLPGMLAATGLQLLGGEVETHVSGPGEPGYEFLRASLLAVVPKLIAAGVIEDNLARLEGFFSQPGSLVTGASLVAAWVAGHHDRDSLDRRSARPARLAAPRQRPPAAHREFHTLAEQWCERFGPIFRFDLGSRRIVGIADADEINTILRARPAGFRRWREIESVAQELAGSVGVFHVEGEDWRHQRRLAVTALNSNHLQRYFDVVRTCTGRLYRRLTVAAAAASHLTSPASSPRLRST